MRPAINHEDLEVRRIAMDFAVKASKIEDAPQDVVKRAEAFYNFLIGMASASGAFGTTIISAVGCMVDSESCSATPQ